MLCTARALRQLEGAGGGQLGQWPAVSFW